MKEIFKGVLTLLAAAGLFLAMHLFIAARAHAHDAVTCQAGVCTYTITADTNDLWMWSWDADWSLARAGDDGGDDDDVAYARSAACFFHTGEYFIHRSVLPFDTGGIRGRVTAARALLQSLSKNNAGYVVLTGASGTAWGDINDTEYCGRMDHDDWAPWGPEVRHEVTLNAAAVDAVNATLGGVFHMAFRNADKDVDNVPPTGDDVACGMYFADEAGGKVPQLVLTVEEPSNGDYSIFW